MASDVFLARGINLLARINVFLAHGINFLTRGINLLAHRNVVLVHGSHFLARGINLLARINVSDSLARWNQFRMKGRGINLTNVAHFRLLKKI